MEFNQGYEFCCICAIIFAYKTKATNLMPVLWTVDTGGKFATGVVDTGGAPLLVSISANF